MQSKKGLSIKTYRSIERTNYPLDYTQCFNRADALYLFKNCHILVLYFTSKYKVFFLLLLFLYHEYRAEDIKDSKYQIFMST